MRVANIGVPSGRSNLTCEALSTDGAGGLQFMSRYVVAMCDGTGVPCLDVGPWEDDESNVDALLQLAHPRLRDHFLTLDPKVGYTPNAAKRRMYPQG